MAELVPTSASQLDPFHNREAQGAGGGDEEAKGVVLPGDGQRVGGRPVFGRQLKADVEVGAHRSSVAA